MRRLERLLPVVAALWLAAVRLNAAGPLPLEEAVKEALLRNPELRALHARASAQSEVSARERALPDPSLTYGAMSPSESVRVVDSDEMRVTLAQEIPGFGKRAIRGRLADTEAALLWVDLRILENDIRFRVREAGYELAAVQESLALLRREQALLAGIEEAARARLSSGGTDSMDVLSAQSEVMSLRQRLIDLERREKGLQARLGQLLNRDSREPIEGIAAGEPEPVALDIPLLIRQALDTKPEIEAARRRVEQSEFSARLAGKRAWPDFMISAERRFSSEEDDRIMFMFGLTLPIWRDAIRAGNREAAGNVEAGAASLEAVERDVRFEIEDAAYALENARRSLALSREALIPQAQQRFAAAEAAYRAGTLPFAALLESERFWLEARIMAAMTRAEEGRQAARLERALGRPLKARAQP